MIWDWQGKVSVRYSKPWIERIRKKGRRARYDCDRIGSQNNDGLFELSIKMGIFVFSGTQCYSWGCGQDKKYLHGASFIRVYLHPTRMYIFKSKYSRNCYDRHGRMKLRMGWGERRTTGYALLYTHISDVEVSAGGSRITSFFLLSDSESALGIGRLINYTWKSSPQPFQQRRNNIFYHLESMIVDPNNCVKRDKPIRVMAQIVKLYASLARNRSNSEAAWYDF